MHRSGTSALARVLNLLGAALPDNLMPSAPGNETGHWEPAEVAALHEEILASVGSQWNGLAGPDERWFHSPQADAFVARIKAIVLSEYGDAPLFVVKDPRLSLLFPLWSRALRELDIACKPIIAVRNPMEIAQSLCRREGEAHPQEVWHIDRGGLIFLRYILAAERWTRPYERVFAHYDDLLGDWRGTMRRLGKGLHVVWPRAEAEDEIDGFLSTSHRHHRAADNLAIHGIFWAQWISPVYSALKSACSGDPVDEAHFDRAALAYDAACNAFARHYDAASHDLVAQIAALKSSTSWRITAPLRKIVDDFRAWRGERGGGLRAPAPPAVLSIGTANAGARAPAMTMRKPLLVTLGALGCAVGLAGLTFLAQGAAGSSRFASAPVDAGWSATKIERFGASPLPPLAAQEDRRQACLPGLYREIAERAPSFRPAWTSRAFAPGAVSPPLFQSRESWYACGVRGWRDAPLPLRI
jgi:hypothetical protein